MALSKQNELIGFIPLAGRGMRMRPITTTLPKALIEIQYKTLLERAIEALKMIGIKKVILVAGYRGEKISNFLETNDLNIQIELISQKEQLGLSHAIFISMKHLTSDFVLLCPDSLYTNPDDLLQARNAFRQYKPAALQVVTLAPAAQERRLIYSSNGFRNIAPNLFSNGQKNNAAAGLALHSTGLAFFSKDSLVHLSSLADLDSDVGFPNFMLSLKNNRDFMLYLTRGTRYDFTEPDDIDSYLRLQEGFSDTVSAGVSAILINKHGQMLLHLRDNAAAIRYPAHWALFGGSIDKNETPYECIEREIKEEIGYELLNYGLFREFIQNNKREYAFVGEIDRELSGLVLKEGCGMKFFEPGEIASLKIRPDDRGSLKAYLGNKFNG